MEHYQKHMKCYVCQNEIVLDIFSWGTPHQEVQAATCLKCAKPASLFEDRRQIILPPKKQDDEGDFIVQ